MQDAIDIRRRLLKYVDVVNSVGHEGAGGDEITPRVNRGQTVACCERDNEIAMGDDRGIRDDEEAAVGHSRERFNRALNVGVVVADRTWDEFNRERWRRRRGKSQEVVIPSALW